MSTSSFGTFIRTLRLQNHMTQATLAEKLHVTDKAVSKWERGISWPDLSHFSRISEVLGVTLEDLVQECIDDERPSRLRQILEMSHDLRTPLQIILGCAELAQTHLDDPVRLQHYLDSIQVSGEYLLAVIDRLLVPGEQDNKNQEGDTVNADGRNLERCLKMRPSDRGGLSRKYRFGGKRILVAEDMELNREIIEEMLKQSDVKLEFAENGKQCVEMMEKKPERVVEMAVKGMLPKNSLGRKMFKKLHVYAGPEHEQAAQKPEVLDLKK